MPQATAFLPTTFDGSLDGEIGSASSQSADGTSGSVLVTIPADVSGTCSTSGVSDVGNTQTTYTTGTVGSRSNMVKIKVETCTDISSCSNPAGNASQSACSALDPSGTWTSASEFLSLIHI